MHVNRFWIASWSTSLQNAPLCNENSRFGSNSLSQTHWIVPVNCLSMVTCHAFTVWGSGDCQHAIYQLLLYNHLFPPPKSISFSYHSHQHLGSSSFLTFLLHYIPYLAHFLSYISTPSPSHFTSYTYKCILTSLSTYTIQHSTAYPYPHTLHTFHISYNISNSNTNHAHLIQIAKSSTSFLLIWSPKTFDWQLFPLAMASSSAQTKPTVYSMDLFGFRFDYSRIHTLQLRLSTNYGLSDQERLDLSNEMTTLFRAMINDGKKILSEHCTCPNPQCRERPLVTNSQHEFFTGQADILWQKLVVLISGKFTLFSQI